MMGFHVREDRNDFLFRQCKENLKLATKSQKTVFDKRPSNQELIFGHILLSYEEGQPMTPVI